VDEGAEDREGSSKRASTARGERRRKMILIFLQFYLVKHDLKFTCLNLSLAKENLNQWKFDKTRGDYSNELE